MLLLFVTTSIRAQEITALEVVKTIEHQNYNVGTLDVYFENGRQLIAYSNVSGGGGGDTLVIYDFEADQILAKVPGTVWSYEIRFINDDQLLFKNDQKLYRLVNFSSPMITEVATGVITFGISDDRQDIALIKYGGLAYNVEVSSYNSNTGALSSPDIYEVTEEINWNDSRIIFSPDGNYIAMNGGYDNDFVVFINLSSSGVTTVATPDNQGTYSPVFYNQGSLRLAVGGGYQNGSIEVIKMSSLSVETSIPVFANYNYALDFDPSQGYVVTGGFNDTIKVFRVEGTDFTEVAKTSSHLINRLMFTQDNQYVVSGEGPTGGARLVIFEIVRGPSAVSNADVASRYVYPNPVHDILYIEGMDDALISMYDMYGKLILGEQMKDGKIDVSDLNEGVYVLKTGLNDGIYTALIIKN